jgi:hypothetical protein
MSQSEVLAYHRIYEEILNQVLVYFIYLAFYSPISGLAFIYIPA